MFISKDRYGSFSAHETRAEAVKACIDSLNGDYSGDYWPSDDGESIIGNPHSRLDFTLAVYDSPENAILAHAGLDTEALPFVLIALAETIETAINAGIE